MILNYDNSECYNNSGFQTDQKQSNNESVEGICRFQRHKQETTHTQLTIYLVPQLGNYEVIYQVFLLLCNSYYFQYFIIIISILYNVISNCMITFYLLCNHTTFASWLIYLPNICGQPS